MFGPKKKDKNIHKIPNLEYRLLNITFVHVIDGKIPDCVEVNSKLDKALQNPKIFNHHMFKSPWNIAVVVGTQYIRDSSFGGTEVSQIAARASFYDASPKQIIDAQSIMRDAPTQPFSVNIADLFNVKPKDSDFSYEETPHTNHVRNVLAVDAFLRTRAAFAGSAVMIEESDPREEKSESDILPFVIPECRSGERLAVKKWSYV